MEDGQFNCWQFDGYQDLGVSKNRGTPKWMVYFMENPIKMDCLGVPLFLETPISTETCMEVLQKSEV